MAQIEGTPISGVGEAGAADGGQIVHFQLVQSNGERARFLVPYQAMKRILFALETAMSAATEEMAKRPGFDQFADAYRTGLTGHAVGHAVAPGQGGLVVLQLRTKLGAQLALMMPPEMAEQIGSDLADQAVQARTSSPHKPS